jgi:hypothetical protein
VDHGTPGGYHVSPHAGLRIVPIVVQAALTGPGSAVPPTVAEGVRPAPVTARARGTRNDRLSLTPAPDADLET